MGDQFSITFLKLGGSLITEKSKAHTARMAVLQRLAAEIKEAWDENQAMRLILGHGSGSYGHSAAKKYNTRDGVTDPIEWRGFAEVWHAAALLNRLVVDACYEAGLPVIAFSPIASVTSENRCVSSWQISPLQAALQVGLIPIIQGDVIFDAHLGGTILSTEDLFLYLSTQFHPQRILLAGIEPGIWADYPTCSRLVKEMTPKDWDDHGQISTHLTIQGSAAPDVTGGMAAKVHQSLQMIKNMPTSEVNIFSGEEPGAVKHALLGARLGTCLHS